MNYDFWLRSAALLLTALTSLIPAFFGLIHVRRNQLREDFKFALLVFKEIEASPNIHPFLREKGLQALAGDSKLSAAEVEYVVNKLKNPVRSLNDYVFGRGYLEHFTTATEAQIIFRKKYQKNRSRLIRKAFYLLAYIGCFMLTFSPILLPTTAWHTPAQAISILVITVTVFAPLSLLSLREGVRISRAEALVKVQQEKMGQASILEILRT